MAPMDAAVAAMKFGIVKRATPGVGRSIALLELSVVAVAVAAFVTDDQRVMRVAFGLIVALLVFFTGLIVRSLARGESFACNCFGRSRAAEPISRSGIVRNAVLLSLPLLGLVGASIDPEPIDFSIAQKAIAIVLGAGALAFVQAAFTLITVNSDPFGLDRARWEERSYAVPRARR